MWSKSICGKEIRKWEVVLIQIRYVLVLSALLNIMWDHDLTLLWECRYIYIYMSRSWSCFEKLKVHTSGLDTLIFPGTAVPMHAFIHTNHCELACITQWSCHARDLAYIYIYMRTRPGDEATCGRCITNKPTYIGTAIFSYQWLVWGLLRLTPIILHDS